MQVTVKETTKYSLIYKQVNLDEYILVYCSDFIMKDRIQYGSLSEQDLRSYLIENQNDDFFILEKSVVKLLDHFRIIDFELLC
jgi:hypothetical protein